MTNDYFLAWLGLALLVGAALGAGAAWHTAQRRFASRLNVTAKQIQLQHASEAKELRAAQLRAQSELEQARQSFKRQLATAAEGPRAAAMRAEERLRAAYDELDRLRRESNRESRNETSTTDGFAATQPMLQKA